MDKKLTTPATIYQDRDGHLFLHLEAFKTPMHMTQQMIHELNMSLNLDLLDGFDQKAYDYAYGYAPRPVVVELTPLQKEVEGIVVQIQPQIDKYGYYSVSTCDINYYGWSKLKHSAMEYLQRNPPEGMVVSRKVNHEVTDWKIMQK